MKQVLINLIGNALKFTFTGYISVTVSIEKNDMGDEFLSFKVRDTGIGIKKEDRHKIFQMFGKLDATANINTTGIGLGLSICKKIAEALDGTIYLAESQTLSRSNSLTHILQQ